LMRLYNRRFAAMARRRRADGSFGRHNAGRRDLFPGFNFRVPYLLKVVAGALAGWLRLELTEGWRSWGRGVHAPAAANREQAAPELGYAVTR
jgi:hypothetical protein